MPTISVGQVMGASPERLNATGVGCPAEAADALASSRLLVDDEANRRGVPGGSLSAWPTGGRRDFRTELFQDNCC